MRALVTGAARRVGAAIAVELAGHGFEVAVHYHRSSAEAEAVVQRCRAAGSDAWAVAADLATTAGARALVREVGSRWDRLDLLVHNASLYEGVPFEEITLEAWDRLQTIHTTAPFLISQGLLSQLRAAQGLVVHLCDIGGERPVRGYAHYSVSKAALIMLTRAMAVELAPAVRTVGISPGQVAWPEHYDQATRERLARRIPMGRVGSPEDVARLVRFIALEGTYLNGVIVPVDGGLAARY